MPRNLKRRYGGGDLHFITFSCYRRLPLLGTVASRNLFLTALEQVRRKYQFVIVGYVVMPEHVHLLLSEPEITDLSVVIKALKQSVSRRTLKSGLKMRSPGSKSITPAAAVRRYWQARFYDFNVFSDKKRTEKLRYIHRNPVSRGLVRSPEDWRWSSYRHYALGEQGVVQVCAPISSRWSVAPLPVR